MSSVISANNAHNFYIFHNKIKTDVYLKEIPGGYYCFLERKSPFYRKWNKEFNSLEITIDVIDLYEDDLKYRAYNFEITGIGLVTGSVTGYLAIDFDGTSTIPLFIEIFGAYIMDDVNKSVSWTSGREGRKQVLFRIPEKYRYINQHIKKINSNAEGEQIEFRYNDMQSVMPPSLSFNSVSRNYFWINNPVDHPILDLPTIILDHIFRKPEVSRSITTSKGLPKHINRNLYIDLIEMISQKELILNYEDWRNLTWQSISLLGNIEGVNLMHELYPEWVPGEYQILSNYFDPSRAAGPGSLISMSKRINQSEAQDILKKYQFPKDRKNEVSDRLNWRFRKIIDNIGK
jgi:hypothetical protein